MVAMADALELQCWIHPMMKIKFEFREQEFRFRVAPTILVCDLMELVEDLYERKSEMAGFPVQMQIQVLWNTKNQSKALNPNEPVGTFFVSGDKFGIFGDALAAPAPLPPNKPEEDKLPVTILTGFLGSGKTTLLNYILEEQKEKKIAVIENEFGEISIDDALLKKDKMALAEKIVVMDNGCMCCTVRGDLEEGLRKILDEIKKGGTTIDQILIETTGMADPVPIVRTFMTNEFLTRELRLDGVLTVADAKHIVARLDDDVEADKVNEAYQQVAFCDKIILNKLDLVTTDQAIAVKERIRSINSFAKILPAVKSRVKLSQIFNLRAHDMGNFVNIDIEKEAAAEEEEHHGHGEHGHEGHGGHGHGHEQDHGHGHGHGHEGHGGHGHGHEHEHGPAAKKSRHDSRVNSCAFVQEGEIEPSLLGEWMQKIANQPAEDGVIFRIKGIFSIKGHPNKHVFHAVMDVSDEDDAGPWGEGEKRVSKVVFIGKGLDKRKLEEGFKSIFCTRV